jgi:hypothetical protein
MSTRSRTYLRWRMSLIDEFLPIFDVSDALAVVADADATSTRSALMAADLIEVARRCALVGMLGALRALPQGATKLLHGERPSATPARLGLDELAELPARDGGWILLGRSQQEEIALGLVGKCWREYAELDANAFKAFAEPGYAKTVYALAVRPIEHQRTLLRGVMRTATSDEHARRWFRRYWMFGVGSGAHILVNRLLDVVRQHAEGSARQSWRTPESPG